MSSPDSSTLAQDAAWIGRVRYAAGRTQPLHVHDAAQITIVLAGSLRERVGRSEEQAGPLSVVVKRRGVEHANVFGPAGTETFTVVLPGEAGEQLLHAAGDVQPWRWLHAPPAVRPFLRIAARTRGRESVASDDATLLDLIAAAATDPAPPRGAPPAWLRRVRERIDDDDVATTRVGRIAEDAGVHPVYLARCFRTWFGCTVSAYLQRIRLRRAAALVPHAPTLTTVAHAAGYADQAHFCRQFRDATGITPGEFARLAANPRRI